MITEPKVTVLAYTMVTDEADDFLPLPAGADDEGVDAADFLAEFAGRACYQSWDRPNPKTATTAGYIDHILDVKHYSVLAHASVSFYIEGVSRSLTHELVRHRFLAFSQLSQRYVDGKDMDWVVPPLVIGDDVQSQTIQATMEAQFRGAVERYEELSRVLRFRAVEQGYSDTLAKKRAREAARAVLPNETETKIVVSGNLRAWRDFLAQRWTAGADLEIQRLAGMLLVELRSIAPATFADFGNEPA